MNENIASVRVNVDTGEIIDQYYYGDIVSKVSAKTIEFLSKTIEINKNKKYSMSIDLAFRILPTLKLKASSYSVLMVMLSSLGFGSHCNYVIKLENKKMVGYMNGEDIRKLAYIKESAFADAIKELEEKQIIKKIKAKKGSGNNFILNPFIACHNQRIPIEIFKMFEDTIFNYTNQSSQISSKEMNERIKQEKEMIKELEKLYSKQELRKIQKEMSYWS